MGLSRIFGFCVAILFASSVTAAEIIDLGPSDYRKWGAGGYRHTPQGINARIPQPVNLGPNLNTLTVTRNPVVPYGSVANGMRQFVRVNPASVAASAAITGLFLAVDWVFDQASGEWRKEGEDVIEDLELSLWTYCSGLVCIGGPTPQAACDAAHETFGGGALTADQFADDAARCRRPTGSSALTIRRTGSCPAGSLYSPTLGGCVIEGEYIPLTDSDFSELAGYLPSAPASDVGEAAGDVQRRIGDPLPGYTDTQIEGPSTTQGPETTTTTTTETGDSVTTSTTTTTNYSYGDTTITTTNTTITNTYTNGEHTSTTTETTAPGELPVVQSPPATELEFPPFCEWAKVVCDWFDWTQEDPGFEDPDLPVPIDEDYSEQKTISFGAKSCPPDYEINIPFMNTTVSVPFQPLCDFAGIIYYMVMAAAYVIAAYISLGVARNG